MDDCPLCAEHDPHTLEKTEHFRVLADHHPLTEGHLLIAPKAHVSCVGAYPDDLLREFKTVYATCMRRLQDLYGNRIDAFEHGNVAQTVLHSHVHLLPSPPELVHVVKPDEEFRVLYEFDDLRALYKKEGFYLFLGSEAGKGMLRTPNMVNAFFRVRFAELLRRPERAHWRTMHANATLMETANREIDDLKKKWKAA